MPQKSVAKHQHPDFTWILAVIVIVLIVRDAMAYFSYQCLFAHPGGDALVHALLEGGAESAIAVVAALLGQLVGDDGLMCSGKFAAAGYEVSDTEVVDVGVVVHALTGEILAEIGAVDADGCRELRQVQVLLQVELCVLAVPRQQLADMVRHRTWPLSSVCGT